MPSTTSSTSGQTTTSKTMRRTNPRAANLENLGSNPRFGTLESQDFKHKPMPSTELLLPDGLPPWLAAFVLDAQRETDTLRENGAEQPASARAALVRKLIAAAQAYLDAELDAGEAALETGRCEE